MLIFHKNTNHCQKNQIAKKKKEELKLQRVSHFPYLYQSYFPLCRLNIIQEIYDIFLVASHVLGSFKFYFLCFICIWNKCMKVLKSMTQFVIVFEIQGELNFLLKKNMNWFKINIKRGIWLLISNNYNCIIFTLNRHLVVYSCPTKGST